MASLLLFAEDLTDDVISQSVLFCKAPDALSVSCACRALLSIVAVTAHRLYTTLFGSGGETESSHTSLESNGQEDSSSVTATDASRCIGSDKGKESSTLPTGFQERRACLLALLDRARSPNPEFVRATFSWAASQGLCVFLSRAAARWCQSDITSLLNHCGKDSSTALCRAAKKQKEEAVALLLNLGADPDLAGKGGHTPLFWAARCGHPGIVQRLLERGASPIKVGKRGDCPLGAVLGAGGATPGKVEALRQLADYLDASQRSSAPAVRALHDACAAGEAQIVEVLVEFGIGLAMPLPGVSTSTPEFLSNSAQPSVVHSSGQLLSATATDVRDRPPPPPARPSSTAGIGGAGLFGGAVAVAAPITQRPPAQRPGGLRPRSGRSRGNTIGGAPIGSTSSSTLPAFGNDTECQDSTPLLTAAGKGFSDIVCVLLDRHVQSGAYINACLPSGKSALHLAAERGDAKICAKLLGAGASIGATTCSGRSALFAAVEHGNVEAVRAICEKAEVWHLTQQTPNGVSPLTLAERRGKPSLILPLLRCYHRHIRNRFLQRQPGGAVTDVTDPYLTLLCLKFKDQLFRPHSSEGESTSQISRSARQNAVEGETPSGGEHSVSATGRAPLTAANRHTRAVELTRIERNDLVEVRKPRPQSARSGGVAQLRRHSETPSSDSMPSMRKPWGSSASSRRPRPGSASCVRSGSRKVVARTSSGDLWQRASAVAQRNCGEASSVRSNLSETIVAGPIGAALRPQQAVSEGSWCQGGESVLWPLDTRSLNDREEAAMEADDAMAELLAGYFSEDSLIDEDTSEDTKCALGMPMKEIIHLPAAQNIRWTAECDSTMYSDDSGDEEGLAYGTHSAPVAYFQSRVVPLN